MDNIIPYGKQFVDEEDILNVTNILRSDWLTQGPVLDHFETKISEYCNVKYTVACNSGTSALHLACMALELGVEDEVWTSPISFVASANVAILCGSKISFVDIDKNTWCLSSDKLEQKLIERKKNNLKLPKLVIPVHLAGLSCEMEKIKKLSNEYGFYILEDASHALGGKYKNEKIGSCIYSDLCVFSFHPVKSITTGEGGVCNTNNKKLYEKMLLLRTHGITKDKNKFFKKNYGSWYYEQHLLGYNYRLSDIHAALGISQLKKINKFIKKRNEISDFYEQNLKDLPIVTQKVSKFCYSARHLFVIRINEKYKNDLFISLQNHNVKVNLHYFPIHLQPFYQKLGFKKGMYINSENYFEQAISLPIFPSLDKDSQTKVINIIKQYTGD